MIILQSYNFFPFRSDEEEGIEKVREHVRLACVHLRFSDRPQRDVNTSVLFGKFAIPARFSRKLVEPVIHPSNCASCGFTFHQIERIFLLSSFIKHGKTWRKSVLESVRARARKLRNRFLRLFLKRSRISFLPKTFSFFPPPPLLFRKIKQKYHDVYK